MSMAELWGELHGYIRLEFDARDYGSSNSDARSDTSVLAKLTVTNTSHPGIQPDIVFEEVTLHLGVPPNWQEIRLGSLHPGESKTHERQIRLSELTHLQYEFTGTLSPKAFFSQSRNGMFPGSGIAISLESYIHLYNDIDVHRWLRNTLQDFHMPGPDSTLSDIQSLSSSLEQPVNEVREAQEQLKRIGTFVDGGQRITREAVTEHQNLVHPYLEEVARAISQLRQALRNPNIQQLEAQIQQTIARLSDQADRLDKATKTLLI